MFTIGNKIPLLLGWICASFNYLYCSQAISLWKTIWRPQEYSYPLLTPQQDETGCSCYWGELQRQFHHKGIHPTPHWGKATGSTCRRGTAWHRPAEAASRHCSVTDFPLSNTFMTSLKTLPCWKGIESRGGRWQNKQLPCFSVKVRITFVCCKAFSTLLGSLSPPAMACCLHSTSLSTSFSLCREST